MTLAMKVTATELSRHFVIVVQASLLFFNLVRVVPLLCVFLDGELVRRNFSNYSLLLRQALLFE